MRSAGKCASLLFYIVCGSSSILWDQEACKPPDLDLSASGPNIFSAQQEQELGEVMASRLSYLPFSDDPAVTAYLERIGGQLLRYLPPTEFCFRYFLVDSAAADAFSIPVRFVGVGEAVEDLRDFSAEEFVEALFDA